MNCGCRLSNPKETWMARQISPTSLCPGTASRRGFLHAGISAVGGLGLASLLQRESAARAAGHPLQSPKSMIVLWLWGGPSHMETFDLKPDAPLEYRGEFRPIPTNVPGIEISEHLPRLAGLADQFSLIRSISHDSPGHVNSTHTLVTAYPGELIENVPYAPKHPDLWSVVHKFLGPRRVGLPAHVALNHVRYFGSAYLGSGLEPFNVGADPNSPKFKVPSLGMHPALSADRVSSRVDLLKEFDDYRRDLDRSRLMDTMDEFQQKAVNVLVSSHAREAFDLSQETPELRDAYGRHQVGQQCLLARRLVEAGVRLVTIDFPYVPGQKAKSWDDHASVWNIFTEMKARLPVVDQVVSTLIHDLRQRGLDQDVLLLVMGEMSHTPRLSNFQGQPGREHWGQTMSAFLSGGGLRMGQVIGSTNSKGDEVVDRPLAPNDFLATCYRYFGIPLDTQFTDFGGRPTPMVPEGAPIHELFA